MSLSSPGIRVCMLMAGTSALLFWTTHHAEVSFADGLRYLREAQQITEGDYSGGVLRAIDHPMHALSIAATHAVLGGSGPYAWQTAAQVAAVFALVLAVIPLYLLARETFEDETTAWVACLLVVANPVLGDVAINVLSESTFLLFWLWGLWASARFLREGRLTWLPAAIAFGVLAYLTRPEGLLLHASLVGTLLLLPLHRVTRIYWPRWWAAVLLLIVGPALLAGPYIAIKGGIGTKPAIARVIGTLPKSPPSALERESPPPAGQTPVQAYASATLKMLKAFRGAVTLPLIPLAMIGLMVARPRAGRARLGLFFGVLIGVSALGLVRLHVTGGYCTVRHALIPAILLIFAAAHGLTWLLKTASIDAKRLHLGEGRLQAGPVVWLAVLALFVARPFFEGKTSYASSFAPYRMAGSWIAERSDTDGHVLDMTDWSLFFSQKQGKGFEAVTEAAALRETRWLVLREAHVKGHNRAGEVARQLVAGRDPMARFPEHPEAGQIQVLIYDLSRPIEAVAREIPNDGVRLR